MLKKFILGTVLAVILAVGGLVLFFPLDSFIKKKIDESIGPYISFSSLRIRWNSIAADDVVIKTPAGTDFLKIKQLRLRPAMLGLLRKKLEIKGIELDSPVLVIKKARDGRWLIPEFRTNGGKSSVEVIVRSVKADNGTILFVDEVQGARFDLSNVGIDMRSRLSLFSSAITSIDASAKVSPSGSISVNSEGSMLTGKFKGTLSIKDLSMALLRPYIKGDVEIKRGRLNLDSNISLDKGYIRAPSNLRLRDMDVEARGIVMGVSAPLVLELIKKKGAITITFNFWGKWNNLQNDLKEAFQKEILTGVGRTVVSPIEEVVTGTGIGNLLKKVGIK